MADGRHDLELCKATVHSKFYSYTNFDLLLDYEVGFTST